MKILYHKYLNHEAVSSFFRETLSASLMIAFFNLQLEGFDRYKYSCKDTRYLHKDFDKMNF